MNHIKIKSKPLFLYFVIVIIASAAVEALIITKKADILYLALMWIPALAASAANLVKVKLSDEKTSFSGFFRGIGFRRCKLRYIAFGCLIPLIYILIPYMIYWHMYPENFAYSGVPISVILKDLTLPVILGVFISLLSALGEEIGWRGFMVPELYNNFGIEWALIISSAFWCFWHLPLLIFGDYMEGTDALFGVPAFILCIFPVGVITGLLSVKTKSFWPAAFLHAAHNNYDQAVFGLITKGDDKMYFVSETGIFTIICVWIIAAAMYLTMRNRQFCEMTDFN